MTLKPVLLFGLLGPSLFAALAPGVSEGLRGNTLLESGNATAADSVYRQALSFDNLESWTESRLQNNLGLARARTGRLGMADSAFTRALSVEADPTRRAAIAYNAGTAALLANRFDASIAYLRRALVLAPGDTLARKNLEIALRRNTPGTEQPEPPEAPEPSAFARRTKARADSLLRQRRYLDALALMRSALARDTTMLAFQKFMARLEGVVRIDTGEAPGHPPTE